MSNSIYKKKAERKLIQMIWEWTKIRNALMMTSNRCSYVPPHYSWQVMKQQTIYHKWSVSYTKKKLDKKMVRCEPGLQQHVSLNTVPFLTRHFSSSCPGWPPAVSFLQLLLLARNCSTGWRHVSFAGSLGTCLDTTGVDRSLTGYRKRYCKALMFLVRE